MSDASPIAIAAALSGDPSFTPEPGVGVVLLHRQDGSGRTVRLNMDRARETYLVDQQREGWLPPGFNRALAFEARLAISRDREREWEEAKRVLATADGVVPVDVARRYVEMAARSQRAACAAFVHARGMDAPRGRLDARALCQVGLDIYTLVPLSTDTDG